MTTRTATDDGTYCRILVKLDQPRWFWAIKLDMTPHVHGQALSMYIFMEGDGITLAGQPASPLIGTPLQERPAQLVNGALNLVEA